MECRKGCAACCVAPSISSSIPGMPHGKPAGVSCVQLTPAGYCRLFGLPERPVVCGGFQPMEDVCGASRAEAFELIARLELLTG